MKKNKNNNKNKQSDNEIFLNGPLNYIKLINKKTSQSIWLFMDFHKDIIHQNKCEEYDAKDFYKFINKKLLESNELIDFFLEINPTDINKNNNSNENGIYIEETRKIFRKIYSNQKSSHKQNIRLHYIDIRDYAFMYDFYKQINSIFSLLKSSGLENIESIINKLINIKSTLEFINQLISKIKENKLIIDEKNIKIDFINIKIESSDKKNYSFYDILNTGFYQLLSTILLKYNNKTNKENIIKYFDQNYLENSIELVKFINDFISKMNIIAKKIKEQDDKQEINIDKIVLNSKLKDSRVYYGINKYEYEKDYNFIFGTIEKIEVIIAKLGCVFMDCFFLRRLIEKDYISKSIVYTGAYHSSIYIWFLIKYYGYQIDDYEYINTELLDNNDPIVSLEKIIDKSNNYDELFVYLVPKKFTQCVKIKDAF